LKRLGVRLSLPGCRTIVSVLDTNVRYNWAVYDQYNVQGNVIQSAQDWGNGNPNPVNARYA
jgi:hypothetical protein